MKTRISILVLLFALLAGAAWAQSPGDDCRVIDAWIDANRDALPQTYEEMLELPTAYVPRVLDALDAGTRGEIWREHLRRYEAAHADELTAAQVALIDETSYVLAAGIPGDRTRIEGLAQRAQAAFGPEEAQDAFYRLGSTDRSSEQAPDGVRIPLCNCANDSECPTFCDQLAWCKFRMTGCGYAGSQPCTGICR